MRRYETVTIIDPDLAEDQYGPVFDRIRDLMPKYDGFLVDIEDWGAKKLAYDVKKRKMGHYFRMDYCGEGSLVDEIERFFRIDDRVLKYLTMSLDKNVDVEALKEEMARAAEAAEAAEAEKARREKEAAEAAAAAEAEAANDAPEADAQEPEAAEDAAGTATEDAAETPETETDDEAD